MSGSKARQIELRKQLRHPGEVPWLAVSIVVGLLGYAVVIGVLIAAATNNDPGGYSANNLFAQFALLLALSPFALWFGRGLLYAQQRASAVRMTPTQFPEGYAMVVQAAAAAGMRTVPDAYVVSGNGVLNAFASGHGFRRYLIVHSDMFEIGGRARDPEALRFVISHEVGHLAAGHVSYFRQMILTVIRQIPILGMFISRAQEYTADNYGYHAAPQGAAGAIRVLSAGKYLNANVNIHEFADRAATERGPFIFFVNLQSSHPILLWRAQALRDRSRAGALFWQRRFRPYGAPALPPATGATTEFPSPAEAQAYLDAFPPRGPAQFGRNFPDPLPGTEIADPDATDYGHRTLYAGWNRP